MLQEVSYLFRCLLILKHEVLGLENLFLSYLGIHLLSICWSIGCFSENHLEENDSNRPYVSLYKNINTLRPYGCRFITSGAMVVIVPKVVCIISFYPSCILENPISAILYVPLCDRIFSAFRSLWTILWLCNS